MNNFSDEQLLRLDKPITKMQLSIFHRAEQKYKLCWMNKFEFIAAHNNGSEETQGCFRTSYLENSTLIYYNLIPEQTKANQ